MFPCRKFTIKEIDIGLAADLGTLQLFPKIVGNQSTFRELAYTGRIFEAEEAHDIGFMSRVFADREKLEAEVLETARVIASKSPVGVYTIKKVIRNNHKQVYGELDDMARLNSVMLQSEDVTEAVMAFMQKRNPQFPKL